MHVYLNFNYFHFGFYRLHIFVFIQCINVVPLCITCQSQFVFTTCLFQTDFNMSHMFYVFKYSRFSFIFYSIVQIVLLCAVNLRVAYDFFYKRTL